MATGQPNFPAGGLTPVFNEITALLTIAPNRPDPEADFGSLKGVKERMVMQNVIDDQGIVLPTVFVRSPTFTDPQTGLKTQVLTLAACSGIARSEMLGGEVAVHVKGLSDLPEMLPPDLPAAAVRALDMPLIGGRVVTPRQTSVGKIQALSPSSDFPARVTIPVYYSLALGVRGGLIKHATEVVSVEGQEPHLMEAVVNSIPPDPETVLRGRGWDLVTAAGNGFVKLWVKIESFRFLGPGDFQHRERVVYRPH